MKKLLQNLTFLVIIGISAISFSQQDFQGKAYYMSKTTMDLDQWGGREMSPEQKKRIEERMKSFLEKEYILTFNKEESIYKEDEKLEAPGSGRGWGGFASSFTGGPKYKNVKSKELLQDQEFFGKQFLIKDELKSLEWKMGTETKQIGQYTCFKATATKTVDEFDWRSMRRRSDNNRKEGEKKNDSIKKDDDPMNEIEVPKTIEVVAWYTPQVPINQGPDDYWGLPGLILEINADRTTILCTKIIMNPEEKEAIEKPEKGDEVTKAQYNDIITKKMQEMREMYGGRRGDRGRRN
ncbi:ribonuclease Z [Winogradskyella sp. J14-2]|uniref:GLPGLI family protein n=1 Tax=Winogradskyella sp. J14-2 TaxID=1936080 RepID=UPI00097290FD|nr:GLPGLI family protein [Winogradskyella sp. J14-2]APY08835.1 ribonuclease Z [Winogradskyella sp. J14-2]